MLDARQEASIAMENVKETASGMLKTVGAIGKMANSAYLKLLAMRRKQYTDAVDKSRGAQEMVKGSNHPLPFSSEIRLNQFVERSKMGTFILIWLKRFLFKFVFFLEANWTTLSREATKVTTEEELLAAEVTWPEATADSEDSEEEEEKAAATSRKMAKGKMD